MSAFGLAIIVAKQAEIQLSLVYIGVHVPSDSNHLFYGQCYHSQVG